MILLMVHSVLDRSLILCQLLWIQRVPQASMDVVTMDLTIPQASEVASILVMVDGFSSYIVTVDVFNHQDETLLSAFRKGFL